MSRHVQTSLTVVMNSDLWRNWFPLRNLARWISLLEVSMRVISVMTTSTLHMQEFINSGFVIFRVNSKRFSITLILHPNTLVLQNNSRLFCKYQCGRCSLLPVLCFAELMNSFYITICLKSCSISHPEMFIVVCKCSEWRQDLHCRCPTWERSPRSLPW